MNRTKIALATALTLTLPATALAEANPKEGALRVSADIIALPIESAASENQVPLGISLGGNFYANENVAIGGAIGFGLIEDTAVTFAGDIDYGLDPYFRANVKLGDFSKPDYTLYGLIGLEPYTVTVNGQSANESVGDIAFGFGGTLGNARFGQTLGAEYVIIQDSDLDDSITRFSLFLEF